MSDEVAQSIVDPQTHEHNFQESSSPFQFIQFLGLGLILAMYDCYLFEFPDDCRVTEVMRSV
jgi:hypothetical protein